TAPWNRSSRTISIESDPGSPFPGIALAALFSTVSEQRAFSDVVRDFAAAGPWIALDFLLAADTALGGRTALQALRDGDREAVRRLIRIETSDGFA
ncbi:hypothetical protein ACCS96_30485, partial [Rhizobium ruizarguesonis]